MSCVGTKRNCNDPYYWASQIESACGRPRIVRQPYQSHSLSICLGLSVLPKAGKRVGFKGLAQMTNKEK